LTNVSQDLPGRKLVNRAILVTAITFRLESTIIDPTDIQHYTALKAALAVNGKDDFRMEYVTAFNEGKLE